MKRENFIDLLCIVAAGMVMTSAIMLWERHNAASQIDPERVTQNVLSANVTALSNEDWEAAMETIHPQSIFYETTKLHAQQVCDLDLDLDAEFEVLYAAYSSEEDAVHADIKVRTRKVGGASTFLDNELTTTQVLRQHNGQWKIWSTEFVHFEALEDDYQAIE